MVRNLTSRFTKSSVEAMRLVAGVIVPITCLYVVIAIVLYLILWLIQPSSR